MVSWSSLNQILKPFAANLSRNAVRNMGGDHGPRIFPLEPSKFQWNKFKDLLHFYLAIGLIPVLGIVFYTNVFIGPATLEPIPEGYTPKHWEYHRHPISRFISRYMMASPQESYEKYLHYIYEEKEKIDIRKLTNDVREKMSERNDYQAYYYRPVIAKYHRRSKEAREITDVISGD